MRNLKKAAAFLLALTMALSLAACGGVKTEDVTALVQGNLDVIYLGECTDEYLALVTASKEDLMADYEDGLQVEAEYFAEYWGIVYPEYGESYADLPADFQGEIIDLYREIYAHSNYEVSTAVKHEDDSYSCKVTVYPIDIMEKASDCYLADEYPALNAFWQKHENVDFSAMSDEEYMAYTVEYGRIIVELVRDQLPELGYKEAKTQAIQVEADDDGLYRINEDDFGIFDGYVIYYP